MLKPFKILYTRTNNNLLRSIHKNNKNIFKITNYFKFSSSHKHEDHHNIDNHAEDHDDHHGEPQDYHNLKFDRVSYNQKQTKEQRKEYFILLI